MAAKVVLLNIAHIHRCPKRSQGAAVRILGIFSNVEELKRHAARYYDAELDVMAISLRKWSAILQTADNEVDQIEHLNRLSRAYKDREKRHEDEFRENVSEKRTGSVNQKPTLSSNSPPQEEGHALQEAPNVPRDAELRMQTVAIISILPDVEVEDESQQQPGLIVWGAYDSEEQGREHIKNELALIARDVHLDTVAMYEWIPLTGIDTSSIREEFRDESLTDIIQARKDESLHVEQYKVLCEQRGQTPNVLELSAETKSEDPDVPQPLERQLPMSNLADEQISSDIIVEHTCTQ